MEKDERLYHVMQLTQSASRVTEFDHEEQDAWRALAATLAATIGTSALDAPQPLPTPPSFFPEKFPCVFYRYEQKMGGEDAFTFVSSGVRDLYGLESAALLNDSNLLQTAIHKDDVAAVTDSFMTAKENGTSWNYQWRITTSAGQTKWVEGRANQECTADGSSIWDGVIFDITEAKKTALESEKIHAQLRDLCEFSPNPQASVDPKTSHILYCNQTLVKFLGYENKEELIGRPVLDLYHADSVEGAKDAFQEFLHTGEVKGARLQLKHKDGSKIHVLLGVNSARDASGNVILSRAVWRDISDLVAVENSLRTEKSITEALFDAIPDPVLVHDPRTKRPTRWNKALCEATGYTDEEIAALTIPTDLVEKDRRPTHEAHKTTVLEQGRTFFSDHIIGKNGQKLPFEISVAALRPFSNGDQMIVAVARDISARLATEDRLKKSERRFRAIFENVTEGILIADTNTKSFIQANRSVCEMLGYSRDELLSLSVHEIHPADKLPNVLDAFSKQVRGEDHIATDIPCLRKDGTVFHADISSKQIELEGRSCLLGCFRDVTERWKWEAQLAQADRLANMGLLAAGVAHEINNTLSYVLYNLTSLEHELPLLAKTKYDSKQPTAGKTSDSSESNPDTNKLLETVQIRLQDAIHGASRINDITRSLGVFSRSEESNLRPVCVHHIVDTIARIMRHEIEYRGTLITDYPPILPEVIADENRLIQVFLNLIINALHAIDAGDKNNNKLIIKLWADAGNVFTEIRDTGCGIAPEHLPLLFDPFFTTKNIGEGSGLGLSISHSIVREFGGSIEVTSELGQGTVFTVSLPIHQDDQWPDAPNSTREPTFTDIGRVLIIDDEIHLLEVMEEILCDYETVSVKSGTEAKKILEEDPSFDAIVCDLMMSDVTGSELHTWLTVCNPPLAEKIIFITGGVFVAKEKAYLKEVDNPILTKPFDAGDFKNTVGKLIAKAHNRNNREP